MRRAKALEDWMAYWREKSRGCVGRNVRGREVYVPSPSDVDRRIVEVRWLQEQGFCHAVIASVMEHDCPTLERVKQMVLRHGVRETCRRIRWFIENSEYGSCEYDCLGR